MKQRNEMLKAARLSRQWTATFVSRKLRVSQSTYQSWEAGAHRPQPALLRDLCEVFEMSPQDLGFSALTHREAILLQQPRKRKAAHMLDIEGQEQEQAALAETLALWTEGIDSCWRLYMVGGQAELERLLPTYLANLTRPTLHPGPDQMTAARLMALCYQLTGLLELQHGDFISAQASGTQALVYSQLSKDWNVYVASQIRLASIFCARKRVGSALSAYNDALRRINANPDAISPILQSWVFAALGEIQATMSREEEALQFLKLAIAIFPEEPEEDPCYVYMQCDRSLIYLYQGLIFLRLGQPKIAWDAFSQIDGLRPTPPERVRAEFLRQRAYTSIVLGNMIQSCIYLEAAARAAQAINSELAFSEVYTLYEHMLALWGLEPRVRALAKLFQK